MVPISEFESRACKSFDSKDRSRRVCCGEDFCKKQHSDRTAFQRELDVYARGLPYVPRLLSSDEASLTIVTHRSGRTLNPSDASYNTRINELSERFTRDTGLHHNDIRYKNVVRTPDDSLLLIDFESASSVFKDEDHQCILRPDSCSNKFHMRFSM